MSLSGVKAIVCDVNGTMFSLAPLGDRMQQVGLQKTDLQVLLKTCQAFPVSIYLPEPFVVSLLVRVRQPALYG